MVYQVQRRRRLVVGNWKMYGTRASAAALVSRLIAGTESNYTDVAICVPHTLVEYVSRMLEGWPVVPGAQDVSVHDEGAFTGEVSARMLRDAGAQYVIVGHSERRMLHGETNVEAGAKAQRVLLSGITPIVCVGETKEERAAGKTDQVVLSQLDAVVSRVGPDNLSKIVVAYEPVWAIGTGIAASADQAQEVHASIRKFLVDASAHDGAGVRLLYGGSVKAETAAGLFRMRDIDGALVGGASLVHEEFLSIARSAAVLAKDAQTKGPGGKR